MMLRMFSMGMMIILVFWMNVCGCEGRWGWECWWRELWRVGVEDGWEREGECDRERESKKDEGMRVKGMRGGGNMKKYHSKFL